jgi:hypothetical protein
MMKKLSGLLVAALLLAATVTTNAQQVTALYANENSPTSAPSASAVGSGGACTAGAHTVAVSIVGNYLGQAYETGLSNGVNATCVASDSLSLTALPTGSGFATARNIYVSKAGTTGPLFYAQTVADNTTTTATFILSDSLLGTQWSPKATPPMMQQFRMLATQLQPTFDLSVQLGDSTHRLNNLFIGTSGSQFSNATSGAVTVKAPTGALGTPTLLLPTTAGGLGSFFSCGSTGTGNQTCAPATASGLSHVYQGQSTLSSNAATITFPATFTSTTSFMCVANDITTRANPVQMIPASAATATITNTTGASDVIQWICIGQ